MPSVQHLGGTTYRVRLPLPRDPTTGARRTRSVSFQATGKRSADREAARIITEHEAAMKARAQHMGSVNQVLDLWLAETAKTISPTTLPAYRLRVGKIKAKFGTTPIVDLTGPDIEAWYYEIVDQVGTAEVQHIHRVLRAALRWARRRRYVSTVETEPVKVPAHRQYEVRPPTVAALAVLVDGLPRGREWARAVEIAAYTGMRRGEVVGLRWDRLAGGVVEVAHSIAEVKGGARIVKLPKGKRVRDVTVADAVAEVLAEQWAWLEAHGISSPWVFPDWRADRSGQTPRRPGWLSQAWAKHRARFGGESIRLHDLRHAYAVRAIDDGAPITAVSAQLGHAQTSTTTNIYGHATDPGRAAVAAAGVRGLRRPELPAP